MDAQDRKVDEQKVSSDVQHCMCGQEGDGAVQRMYGGAGRGAYWNIFTGCEEVGEHRIKYIYIFIYIL